MPAGFSFAERNILKQEIIPNSKNECCSISKKYRVFCLFNKRQFYETSALLLHKIAFYYRQANGKYALKIHILTEHASAHFLIIGYES